VFFGIAVDDIGIALTFLWCWAPLQRGRADSMLRLHRDKLDTPADIYCCWHCDGSAGVAICAVAGRLRERAKPGAAGKGHGNATAGLVLAIICGCGASFVNFGLAFGAPLIDVAARTRQRYQRRQRGVAALMAAGAFPTCSIAFICCGKIRAEVILRAAASITGRLHLRWPLSGLAARCSMAHRSFNWGLWAPFWAGRFSCL